jgi:signal transduction histidine kinase
MRVPDTSLDDQLRRSRARLIAAADSERRLIERELHDGVEQQLIALAVNVQLARRLADSDATAAGELLEEIGRDVHHALASVQVLARRVYPPLLDARGLGTALREAATVAGISAQVAMDGASRFPANVEGAVYFCCIAALEEVADRAGDGAGASVRIVGRDGLLDFEVDGAGVDGVERPPGPELALARDRVEALGGELTIEIAPGRRTRVSGWIPLYEPSAR